MVAELTPDRKKKKSEDIASYPDPRSNSQDRRLSIQYKKKILELDNENAELKGEIDWLTLQIEQYKGLPSKYKELLEAAVVYRDTRKEHPDSSKEELGAWKRLDNAVEALEKQK